MTGSVPLDVVIGLSFIYVIYSLFATVLLELVLSTFGVRARNLEYSILRMLSDEKKEIKLPGKFRKKDGKDRVIVLSGPLFKNIFVRTGVDIFLAVSRFIHRDKSSVERKLYRGFYERPVIKYMSSGGFHSKPSYISAPNFSKALMDELKDLGGDKESPLLKIREGLNMLGDAPDTKKHIESLLDDANNDLVKFKVLLENWFDDMQERAAGWFKRTTKILLLPVGLAMAIAFKADTLEIVKKLSGDPKARQQLVDMAIAYSKENEASLKYLAENDGQDRAVAEIKQRRDSLQKISKHVQADIDKTNLILGSGWNYPKDLPVLKSMDSCTARCGYFPITFRDSALDFFDWFSSDTTVLINYTDPAELKFYNRTYLSAEYDGIIEASEWAFIWSEFYKKPWGFLLTALAISLGAPFWFDLLNKLVRLRTSVARRTTTNTSEAKERNQNDPASIINRVG